MSVVGISFGNQNSYIAVARQGGIEVIANDYSLRATPTCVAYGTKKRVMGVAARQQAHSNPRNTVMNFKQLLGKHYDFTVKQLHDEGYVPCEMVAVGDNHSDTAFKVDCLGERMTLSPIQVAGAFLFKLKQITESELQRVMDACVVAVPNFFTPQQREAVMAACEVAGVKTVRLVDEGVCLGLAYGVYKNNELPPLAVGDGGKRRVVLFLDVGHSCVQASLIAFKQGQMEVLASDYDVGVGGLLFDEMIRRHFREHIYNRYHVDVKEDPKAWMRLLDESERLKKLMSSTTSPVQLRVECLVGELDVEGQINRATFDDLAQSLYQRVHAMLIRVVNAAKMKRSEVDEVELVGGSSRVPTIRQVVMNLFKTEPKATMNVDESVARGAALQCAFLSPACIIKQFEVVQPVGKGEAEQGRHYTKEELDKWIQTERRMQAADQEERARADAKNALEEYIYSSRKELPTMAEELPQEVADEFHSKLADAEQWLQSTEDDGADVPAEEYETRVALLRSILDRGTSSNDQEAQDKEEGEEGGSKRASIDRDEGEEKNPAGGAAQD